MAAGVSPPLSPRRWDQLRAPQALALVGAYLAGQLLAWLVIAIVAVLRADQEAGPQAFQQEIIRLFPAGLLIAIVAGTVSALVLYRWKAGRSAIATAGEELGWGPSRPRDLVIGLASGLGLAIIYLLGAPLLVASPRLSDMGLLSQLAATGGLPRAAWAFAGVVVGPPVEELIFRGALFSGAARSWGRVTAIGVTTVVFGVLHVPEAWVYWPAAVSITVLGMATAIIRDRTGRILPCIVAHCAYNSMLVLTAYGIGIPVRPG
ncbi:MAG: CPBP family intramembrane metalloprotease [Gemmatimonadota bacterium]|nr:CPBP family intramembrane metalloprotease [Gemmatimonadota bacterium]